MTIATPKAVLDFWFKETPPEQHFKVDPAFDDVVRERFEETWNAARNGDLKNWETNKEGALALIIVLDQFPRNMFRGRGEAFSTDAMALKIAETALARGFDLEATAIVRNFLYLPFMHSESLADQEKCVRLIRERLGETHSSYPFALRHRDAVARFGRFPARNEALGRETTRDEAEFLSKNPFGF